MPASHFGLPAAAAEFLKHGKQFSYDASLCEAGQVLLKRLDQLKLGEVWVLPESPADPHAHKRGHYVVPAISLTGECASYDSEFILAWLPDERRFGSWDCDHGLLIVFQNAEWEDIVRDPLPYLNSQWSGGVGIQFQPWPKYAFKAAR